MSQFEPPKPAINFPNGIQHKEHPVTNHKQTAIEALQQMTLTGKRQLTPAQAKECVEGALPHLRAMIEAEIEAGMPPRNTFTDYQEGIQDGMNRAIRIAGRTNQ